MKNFKLTAALLALCLATTAFTGCGKEEPEKPVQQEQPEPDAIPEGEDDMLTFKPSDLGILPQDKYEYPYAGMNITLTKPLLDKMDTKDIIMLNGADYTDDGKIKYAALYWFSLTEEQKNETATAFDPDAWIAELGKGGVLGVYHVDIVNELDTLTGCTEHKEIGKSADGNYVYYLSTADNVDETLKAELGKTEVTLTEMQELDFEMGKTAFPKRRSDAANVGEFSTEDINGEKYTNDFFAEYDLTLVNVFTTWCSPCINEMPELEKLKQEMKAKGVGVTAIVYDSVTPSGKKDQNVIDTAKQLQKRAKLTFPLLIPDKTEMNGRLSGIDAYPESFFVDKEGNIVSEPYVGARTLEQWKEVVETELTKLKGNN